MSIELTPKLANQLSMMTLNSVFSDMDNFTKSSEVLEMIYWRGIVKGLGGDTNDIEKIPSSIRDGIIHTLSELRECLLKYMVISDSTAKFYSIIRRDPDKWSDEEKSIYEYMHEASKYIDEAMRKLENGEDN